MKTGTEHPEISDGRGEHRGAYRAVSLKILESANAHLSRSQFLKGVMDYLMEFSNCDGVGVVLRYRGRDTRSRLRRSDKVLFDFAERLLLGNFVTEFNWVSNKNRRLEDLCTAVVDGRINVFKKFSTQAGSFWCSDISKCTLLDFSNIEKTYDAGIDLHPEISSWVLLPIWADNDCAGLMSFESRSSAFFSRHQIGLLEQLVQTFGVALTHRQLQLELRERIKELSCLYSIARLVTQPTISLDKILCEAVELLPPGWFYPETTVARITVDETVYATEKFNAAKAILKSDIKISGVIRGMVEVGYIDDKPDLDEGPFLREERHLLDAVAGEISKIVEQYHILRDKENLREQLLHADRLATIGQLAAGVAHELNEPLVSILGFAQLSLKSDNLENQTSQDLKKIVAASLHAREVIRKLLVFAREKKTDRNRISLNDVVTNGLYFLKSRCVSAGIEVISNISEQSPQVIADQSQLVQILTNLAVNSIQAMPNGGRLSVVTTTHKQGVSLSVEDTGSGMSQAIQEKIFDPFFTTKSDDQGTGLGMSVVRDIVRSLGGNIEVESALGRGTKITISFPLASETEQESSIDG